MIKKDTRESTYIRAEFFTRDGGHTSTGIDVYDYESVKPFFYLIECMARHMNITFQWYVPEKKVSSNG